jgi:hypothetical protein
MIVEPDNQPRRKVAATFTALEVVRKLVEPEATMAYWYNEYAMGDGTYVFRFTLDPPVIRRSAWNLWFKHGYYEGTFFQLKLTKAEIVQALGLTGIPLGIGSMIRHKDSNEIRPERRVMQIVVDSAPIVIYNGPMQTVKVN